jgi:hypothetical protein
VALQQFARHSADLFFYGHVRMCHLYSPRRFADEQCIPDAGRVACQFILDAGDAAPQPLNLIGGLRMERNWLGCKVLS